MPNAKRNRRVRPRRRGRAAAVPSCVEWLLREVAPLIRRRKMPRTRSARHMRNAAIEVLEAVRALLDESIAWLRTGRTPAEFKRIRVEE